MTPTLVEDWEALYRAIRSGSDEYVVADGRLRFTVSAFSDRNYRPSVDRSSIRRNPKEAKKNVTDGIAQVFAYEVRAISDIRVEPNDTCSTAVYAVDVIHDPMAETSSQPENLAHCVIQCSPEITRTHFNRKVREALAILATRHGFAVEPAGLQKFSR